MNKTYKLVWSKVRNAWVVASEIAKGHGKDSLSGNRRKNLKIAVMAAFLGGWFACTGTWYASAALPIGTNSIAEGEDAIATGKNSVAIGTGAVATGDNLTGDEIKRILKENEESLKRIEEMKKQVQATELDFNKKYEIYTRVEAAKKKIEENNKLLAETLRPQLNTANQNYNAFKPGYDKAVNEMEQRLSLISNLDFTLIAKDPTNGLNTLAQELKTKSEEGYAFSNDISFYRNYINNYIKAKGDLANNKQIYSTATSDSNRRDIVPNTLANPSGYSLDTSFVTNTLDGTKIGYGSINCYNNELSVSNYGLYYKFAGKNFYLNDRTAILSKTELDAWTAKKAELSQKGLEIINGQKSIFVDETTKQGFKDKLQAYLDYADNIYHAKYEQNCYDEAKAAGNETEVLKHLQKKIEYEDKAQAIAREWNGSNGKSTEVGNRFIGAMNAWKKANIDDIENSNTLAVNTLRNQYLAALADQKQRLDALQRAIDQATAAVEAKERENSQLQPTPEEIEEAKKAEALKQKLEAEKQALQEALDNLKLNDLTNKGTNAIAYGTNALVTGKNAIGIGTDELVTGEDSVGIGRKNTVSGTQSVAVGTENTIAGNNSGAVGTNNSVLSDNSFAIGKNNSINKEAKNNFVLGNDVTISDAVSNSVVLGDGSTLSAPAKVGDVTPYGVVSVGAKGKERQIQNVAAGGKDTDAVNVAQLKALNTKVDKGAIHYFSVKSDDSANPDGTNWNNDGATGNDAVAAGRYAKAYGNQSQATGKNAWSIGAYSQASGYNAVAAAEKGIDAAAYNALSEEEKENYKLNTQSEGTKNTSLYYRTKFKEYTNDEFNALSAMEQHRLTNEKGYRYDKEKEVWTLAPGAVAIGHAAKAIGLSTLAVGDLAEATSKYAVAVGREAEATDVGNTALGYYAKAKGLRSTALGIATRATDFESMAVGPYAWAEGKVSLALGSNAHAKGNNSIAMGRRSESTGESSIALGGGAKTQAQGSVAIGMMAESRQKGSVALGEASLADREAGVWGRDISTGEAMNEDTLLGAVKADYEAAKVKLTELRGQAETLRNDYQASLAKDPVAPNGNHIPSAATIDIGNKLRAKEDEVFAQTIQVNDFVKAWKATQSAISIGNKKIGLTRQITGLAAGTEDTDAVNVAQLKALAMAPMNFYFGGKKEGNTYTPGNTNWSMPLNEFRMDFGDGLKAEQVEKDGKKYTLVTLDKDSLKNDPAFKGAKGADGTNGKSAYEIWKEKTGNDGKTEKEFLDSLKGEKGEKGDPGTPGVKGEKGDPGTPGEKGEKGDPGAPGTPGEKGEKGDPGAKGDKGDPGTPGEKGDKGDPGAKGDKGDPGAKGDKGDPGTPGEKGDKGDPGAKGDKGDPGVKGDPGAKGDKGDPGAKGDKGDPGAPGEKGDKGDPGAKGDKGDPGAKGDKGDPGAKGDKGDPGAKGDKGDPGTPGEKGDKGDPGAKGDKGDPGAKGDKGDPGAKGDKGDPGVKGDPGAKGDKGDPGAKGDKGDPGAKGDKGDPGAPGVKGEKGDPGAKGDKGDPGTPGEKGDKGDPGAKGDKGDPGAKGDKGDPGAKGDKGDPGTPGEKGDKGDPGKSAYEIWKEKPGNDGKSEDDFLKSLKGKDGKDGTGTGGASVEAGKNISVDKTTDPDKAVVSLKDEITVKSVTAGGVTIKDNKITGLAPGEISKDSKDAVNGSQLFATNQMLVNNMNQINNLRDESREGDALGAAMAALKPLDFDPYQRSQVMAGIGYYRGKEAVALGLAYYSNENTLLHAGLSYAGSSELMANAGISYRFGSRHDRKLLSERNKLMPQYKDGVISSVYVMQDEMTKLQKENEILKEKNAKAEAENKEMRSELEILKKQVSKLMEKI